MSHATEGSGKPVVIDCRKCPDGTQIKLPSGAAITPKVLADGQVVFILRLDKVVISGNNPD